MIALEKGREQGHYVAKSELWGSDLTRCQTFRVVLHASATLAASTTRANALVVCQEGHLHWTLLRHIRPNSNSFQAMAKVLCIFTLLLIL